MKTKTMTFCYTTHITKRNEVQDYLTGEGVDYKVKERKDPEADLTKFCFEVTMPSTYKKDVARVVKVMNELRSIR